MGAAFESSPTLLQIATRSTIVQYSRTVLIDFPPTAVHKVCQTFEKKVQKTERVFEGKSNEAQPPNLNLLVKSQVIPSVQANLFFFQTRHKIFSLGLKAQRQQLKRRSNKATPIRPSVRRVQQVFAFATSKRSTMAMVYAILF